MSSKIKSQQTGGGARIKPPELVAPISTDNLHPVFCFQHLDKDFGLSDCQRDEKAALVEKLHFLSQMTWEDIKKLNRHKSGFEKINRGQIRGKVPRFITEDVDHFLAFRFDGMKPMVGHRRENVFHIIWLDRNFTLYDH